MSKIKNMKEVIIKVKFNDVDGYIGHGDDVIELIKEIISINKMQFVLQDLINYAEKNQGKCQVIPGFL